MQWLAKAGAMQWRCTPHPNSRTASGQFVAPRASSGHLPGWGIAGVCLVGAPGCDVCGVNAVVHQGRIHGREDKAHRAHVVPRRAAARPHHGLLSHWCQAKGAGLPPAPPACIIMQPRARADSLSPRAQPHQRQCLQLAEPYRLRSHACTYLLRVMYASCVDTSRLSHTAGCMGALSGTRHPLESWRVCKTHWRAHVCPHASRLATHRWTWGQSRRSRAAEGPTR